MPKDSLSAIRTRNTVTSQRQQVPGRDDQVKNNAGGFVFEVAGEDRIKRFLTLGTDSGTYYQKEQEYTAQNARVVIDWATSNGTRLAQIVTEVSVSGRAPRQNPALFALAAVFAFGDIPAKATARAAFNDVVRTGTHLFTFVKYTEQLRGWGRSVKNAVAGWYQGKDVKDLSYQLVKYRQRENWTHRDLLRSVHPFPATPEHDALYGWACGVEDKAALAKAGDTWVKPFEAAQLIGSPVGKNKGFYAHLIRDYPGLPWEALPDEALTVPETWEALLDAGMPITALIRQLPRLTNLGLASGSALSSVVSQLTDEDKLRKGRVHPVKLLYALKTYAHGHSIKGSSSWTPSQKVVDALDAAFYLSFGTIEPAGKRTLIGMDISGSMTWSQDGVVTCAEGAMAMAMATMATEPGYEVMGFANTFRHLSVSPRRRLDDNLATIRNISFGSTDCSLPMTWALKNKQEYDTFAVYTDNETWAGTIQPFEALRQYRQATGIDAKLVVVGMTATEFTIADPKDPGMLDVAGFDADTPNIISGFSRGDFS